MAVILQEVVGNQYGDRYYPSMSGVARSLNYYPLGNEKAEEGTVNLALGCQATANAQYNQNGNDMSASKAVDGNDETRWSSEGAAPGWLQVDLGEQKSFTQFRILSEGGTGVTVGKQLIGKFKIEGSNDNSKWTLIHQSEDKQAEGFPQDTVVTLEKPTPAPTFSITCRRAPNASPRPISGIISNMWLL